MSNGFVQEMMLRISGVWGVLSGQDERGGQRGGPVLLGLYIVGQISQAGIGICPVLRKKFGRHLEFSQFNARNSVNIGPLCPEIEG